MPGSHRPHLHPLLRIGHHRSVTGPHVIGGGGLSGGPHRGRIGGCGEGELWEEERVEGRVRTLLNVPYRALHL